MWKGGGGEEKKKVNFLRKNASPAISGGRKGTSADDAYEKTMIGGKYRRLNLPGFMAGEGCTMIQ